MSRLTIDITEEQHQALKATALAQGKGEFKDMSALLPGLRVAARGKHFIFCMPQPDGPALILSILHERMDIIARLNPAWSADTLRRIDCEEDPDMHVAILTFEGVNEHDSLTASGILDSVKRADRRATQLSIGLASTRAAPGRDADNLASASFNGRHNHFCHSLICQR